MVYNEYLLIKDMTVMNHERNASVLAFEMYKIAHNLAPKFMIHMMINLIVKHCPRSTCKVSIDENDKCSNKINFCFPIVRTETQSTP